ncbi:MAG: MFS transporter [Ramlibacter sp.]|nr:MFS transporter [Ramlibacter sp.]
MAAQPGPLAGRREWIGLAVIALPCLLYAMDLSVLNLAIPAITADLKPSAAQMLWIVDIYGFLVAGSLITMGTLGDRIGRRKLLMLGGAAFGAASVLAALSHSANMLIAARALLGVAGATLAPSTLSLIRNMFHDPHERRIAIGVWIASFSTGGAIGPLLGGLVLAHFSWQAVFLLAVPVMALLLVLGPLLLPEFRDPEAGRLDLASAALSMAAVLCLIFGMKRMAEHGVTPLGLLAIATGLLLGVIFVARQGRLATPLIDLSLLRQPGFGAALLINILSFFAMFAAFLYEAQYLQLVLGMPALTAGLWTLPSALGFVAGSFVVPTLVRRQGTRRVMVGGLLTGAVGFALLSQVDTQALALLVTGSVVFALGLSPVVALTTDVVIGTAPPERTGAASALSETSSELGGALGIAVLGSIAAAIYRTAVADALPAGLSAAAVDAARSTVGGALALAAQWPEPMGPALQDAARAAFVQGLRVCAGLSAMTMLLAAFLALAALRAPRSSALTDPG